MKEWRYVCVRSTCGHVEIAKWAPSATKRCPECGGTMKRTG